MNEKLDLSRLRARLGDKPRTKAGQVRQAWPAIKELFDAGHKLKDVCLWLNEVGVVIGYSRLSDYINQLKRRDQMLALTESMSILAETARVSNLPPKDPATENASRETKTELERSTDPLANIKQREDRRSGFQYNPEPDVKKLI